MDLVEEKFSIESGPTIDRLCNGKLKEQESISAASRSGMEGFRNQEIDFR
jgi:hypothetical protein